MIKKTTILLISLLATIGVFAQLKISKVNLTSGEITITNYSASSSEDISAYWLCNFPSYDQISSLSVVSGNTTIQPGESLAITWSSAMGSSGEIGLYSSASFSSTAAIVDYLEWGAAGNTREVVGNDAGLWTTGDFLTGATTYYYIGDGSESGLDQWSVSEPLATSAELIIESNLYPNPASSEIHVKFSSSLINGVANVFDASGTLIMSQEVNGTSLDLAVRNLNEGMYILEVSSASGTSVSRFTKQ